MLAGIVLFALALRIAFFFGFGATADDIIYAAMSNDLARRGWEAVDPRAGVNYRLGLSVPVALLFRAFGVNDVTYVVYPLACSILSIVLVFLLGRRLIGNAVGLTAALLLATCPFDAVFASTMTIDIITSCLTAAAVLAFLAARDASRSGAFGWQLLGATAIFGAYMVKEPALYVLPCLGAMTLVRIRDGRVVRRDVAFFAVAGVVLATTVVADWWVTGDPLNRFHVQLPQSGAALGALRHTLLEYPRWIWLRAWGGTMQFGYLFWALIPALVYVVVRRVPGTSVPLLWLLVMVVLLEFLPKQLHPFTLSPRYVRYLHAWLVPASLIIAAALEDVRRWRAAVFWVALAILGASGLVEATILHRWLIDPVTDRNDASRFLTSLPPKAVWSDFWLTSRYAFDMQYVQTLHIPSDLHGKPLQIEVIEKNDLETLWTIPEGYVVTGGSRGEVGMFSVLNLRGHQPPATWTLLEEIDRPLRPWRLEPLRIWEVRPRDGATPPDRE
jgi:4-amino-4-deoxy-L-arabinose transferase-like glycosyltransferase